MNARVLVVEPDRLARQGIRSQLLANGGVVVAEAATGAEALAAATEHRPDVVLLDFRLPDRSGADVCAGILARHPQAAIVVLSARGDEAQVRAAVDAGARAYLLKDVDDLDLPSAIERVLAGERVIDPRATAALLDARGKAEQAKLTGQELSVLRLVAEGLTNPEIGKRLHLSRHTVKEYVSHAMRKLEATNRIEAVRRASSLGLIDAAPAPAPSHAPEDERRDTLVYNEAGGPVSSSDIKVQPLKLDKLQKISELAESTPRDEET